VEKAIPKPLLEERFGLRKDHFAVVYLGENSTYDFWVYMWDEKRRSLGRCLALRIGRRVQTQQGPTWILTYEIGDLDEKTQKSLGDLAKRFFAQVGSSA
jgi:hypothetical protein